MNDTPLVSVCMPAYRHERYVAAAIESILAQDCPDMELVINDDCSPDGTFDIISSYRDPRIRAERNTIRSGPSVTLNSALRRARGRYIALCSSDDRWLPGKLQQQLAHLEQHPHLGASFFRPRLIGSEGQPLPDDAHPLGTDFGGERFNRQQWLARMFFEGNCLCAITPLFRAEALRSTGEFDPLLLQLQDYDFWIRFLALHDIGYMDIRLAEYRVSSGAESLSSNSTAVYARTAWECSQVLRHFAEGEPAEAVHAEPLRGDTLVPWRPRQMTRDFRLAEHALHAAAHLPQQSFAHYLFALDCLRRHADQGLEGGAGEARLFSLPYFEVTGSNLAVNFFLGAERHDLLVPGKPSTPAPQTHSVAQQNGPGSLLKRWFK